jgi:exopolysaccharide biosynthesis polyprenyl glycosylphosphotransferase
VLSALNERTLQVLERRRRAPHPSSRGWLLRRLLLVADLTGLSLAFLLASVAVGRVEGSGSLEPWVEFALFLATLPVWVVAAKLVGLYDRDEFLADHSTLDDFTRVLLLVTLGGFIFGVATGYMQTSTTKVLLFWVLGVLLVVAGRAASRLLARRTTAYVQNALIVGAGDVGQLVARKLLQHPEYGINLVGFVDAEPGARRPDSGHLTVLGTADDLPEIVRTVGVERVIIAFPRDDPERTLELIRSLRDFEVQVDVVPRLFQIMGANAEMHTLGGLPLVALRPVRVSPSSMLLKRAIDILGAAIGLVVTSPLFAGIALWIWLDDGRPIFFRQTRLGLNMEKFTILKFRTMRRGTDDSTHRDGIRAAMDPSAPVGDNGLHKSDRPDAVTRVGRLLRRTSLDELPQLINVLRGEMSLVGPRPSLPYETEHFAPHHFERFIVLPGITGLWQVTARAQSTWYEALDMDVNYVRSWSFGLDFWLMFRTPLQLFRLKTR